MTTHERSQCRLFRLCPLFRACVPRFEVPRGSVGRAGLGRVAASAWWLRLVAGNAELVSAQAAQVRAKVVGMVPGAQARCTGRIGAHAFHIQARRIRRPVPFGHRATGMVEPRRGHVGPARQRSARAAARLADHPRRRCACIAPGQPRRAEVSLSQLARFLPGLWRTVFERYRGLLAFQGGIAPGDLMARCEFTRQLAGSVHIENLTDKHPYSGLGATTATTRARHATCGSSWATSSEPCLRARRAACAAPSSCGRQRPCRAAP